MNLTFIFNMVKHFLRVSTGAPSFPIVHLGNAGPLPLEMGCLMETVADILTYKGTEVHSVTPDTTVLSAVDEMCEKHVGALLVCNAGIPLGIFSERDLMKRVILARRDPLTTRVSDVMTSDVVCVPPSTTAREAMAIMTDRRCRHLPVVVHGKIAGMLSIGDLVRWASQEQAFEIQLLTDYVRGAYA